MPPGLLCAHTCNGMRTRCAHYGWLAACQQSQQLAGAGPPVGQTRCIERADVCGSGDQVFRGLSGGHSKVPHLGGRAGQGRILKLLHWLRPMRTMRSKLACCCAPFASLPSKQAVALKEHIPCFLKPT